jgi:Spy/CpxP family protein refolding chaperone
MKSKGRFWIAGLMVAGLALTAVVWAEEEAGDQDHPGMGHGMDGGMMGQDHLGMLKKKLGLTDDQSEKLKALFKKQMEENKTLRDQTKIDMDTLQLKVDSKASEDEIHKLLDKLDTEHRSLQSSREKMKGKVREILTPTQQAKMLLGMKKMGKMGSWGQHRGMGKGRDGHGKGKDKGGDQDGGAPPPTDKGTMEN